MRHEVGLMRSDNCSGFTPCDLNVPPEITIRYELELLSSAFVVFLCQGGYLLAGALGSAADVVLLAFHAPPGTSGSSLLETLCHSWSPGTVDTNTPVTTLPWNRRTRRGAAETRTNLLAHRKMIASSSFISDLHQVPFKTKVMQTYALLTQHA